MSIPQWLEDLWERVTLWIRIPARNRKSDQIKNIVYKSLDNMGFRVHHIHIDFNTCQDKYYVRPIISGTCKSTRTCVDILANSPAGEVRLETNIFVYQKDNTCDGRNNDRPGVKRHIQPVSHNLYSMKVLQPTRRRHRRCNVLRRRNRMSI